jgi:transposase
VDLTDEQWALVEPHLPVPKRRADGRGRPQVPPRPIFEAILWILRTGAPWHDLPDRYPPYQTCHRRFQTWVRAGVLKKLLRALYEDLRSRGQVDDTEAFIDGTYAPAKRGVSRSAGAAPAPAISTTAAITMAPAISNRGVTGSPSSLDNTTLKLTSSGVLTVGAGILPGLTKLLSWSDKFKVYSVSDTFKPLKDL